MKQVFDRLIDKMNEKQTPLMIGLDPNIEKFPSFINELAGGSLRGTESAAEAIRLFNFGIIDATHDLVPIYKPQSAYYEQYGSAGIKVLEETMRYAKSKGAMVCLDAKRNDIGSTSGAYAEAHLGRVLLPDGSYVRSAIDADIMTVNGYFGIDGIQPFIDVANRDGKGIFVLARTSNKSAGDLQDKVLSNGDNVYMEMAELIGKWGEGHIGDNGVSNVGAVVGATYPEEMAKIRQEYPSVFFLLPGYGVQGGKAETLANGFKNNGYGGVVNSSRGILYAFSDKVFKEKYPQFASPEMYAEAARQKTIDSIVEINGALKDSGKLPAGWTA